MALSIENKIVFITGASSGIGQATAYQMAGQGAHIIIAARRKERLDEMAHQIESKHNVKVLPISLDITDKEQVQASIHNLPQAWQPVDIVVNNAGAALSSGPMQEGNLENWDKTIDINVKGLLYVTRTFLPIMIERDSGHIINIGSIAAQETYPGGNVYSAAKHAVNAITNSLRKDLLGYSIRVSEIDPGAVHTEFNEVRWQDKNKAEAFYQGFQPLLAEDIADTVVYCATRPLHVNVSNMTVYPTAQASCNHLYREQ